MSTLQDADLDNNGMIDKFELSKLLTKLAPLENPIDDLDAIFGKIFFFFTSCCGCVFNVANLPSLLAMVRGAKYAMDQANCMKISTYSALYPCTGHTIMQGSTYLGVFCTYGLGHGPRLVGPWLL